MSDAELVFDNALINFGPVLVFRKPNGDIRFQFRDYPDEGSMEFSPEEWRVIREKFV